jgi:hypothetical protein
MAMQVAAAAGRVSMSVTVKKMVILAGHYYYYY